MNTMSKEAEKPFKINTDTALRFGAGGALAGASLATVLGLAKVIHDMKKDVEPTETDEDQLVLTLPSRAKEAEALIDSLVCENLAAGVPTFGPDMEKSANWQTFVSSLLAAGGGGLAGYALIDKLFEMRRMKELNEKVEMAQEEYMDKLLNAGAEEKIGMDESAGLTAMAKEALFDRTGDPTFDKLDYPLGIAALATLLGAGGSAWLTKKFLDEQSRKGDIDFKPRKPVKIRRVVFKTASAQGEKEAADRAIDPEVIPAAVGVFLDVCSGKPTILSDEKVAEAMIAIDMKPSDLYKQATESFDRFLLTLKQNPDLRKQIRDMAMDQHPVLKYFKWGAGLPYIKDIADQKLYDEVSKKFGPRAADDPMKIKYGSDKSASVLTSMLGSLAAERAIQDSTEAALAKSKAEEEVAATDPKMKMEELVKDLEIGAVDPNAQEFVRKNEAKIRAVLADLAEKGVI